MYFFAFGLDFDIRPFVSGEVAEHLDIRVCCGTRRVRLACALLASFSPKAVLGVDT